jgi:hypothetical protein
MRCAKCGKSIPPGVDQCPECGSFLGAVAGAVPLVPDPSGVPVAQFAPSTHGPPSSREPYSSATITYAPPRRGGYRPIDAPPIPARKKRPSGAARLILVVLALLTLALVGGLALARQMPAFGPLSPHSPQAGTGPQAPVTAAPTATPPPTCPNATPDAAAARALTRAQLTSKLRDAAKKDYRPTDSVTTAHAGQPVYLTFRIATAARGTATVLFCLPQGQVPGIVAIPARSSGRYGQFTLQLPPGTSGEGTAILAWNGQTAAIVRFSVVP